MWTSVTRSTIMLNNPSNTGERMNALSTQLDKKKEDFPTLIPLRKRIIPLIKLKTNPGVHSVNCMLSSGFEYTGDGDTARCKDCRLHISNWTKDMDPWNIHKKQKPDCSFVQSMIPSSSSTGITGNISIPNGQENPSKRIKIEPSDFISVSNNLIETNLLQQVRRRTFSHWPHRTSPSGAQMIEAGFFYCNVDDRVICTYCNLICQKWTPHTDDPCEVHKTLSPHCIYVKSKLMRPATSSIIIVNENSAGVTSADQLSTSNNLTSLRSNEIVSTAARNPDFTEIPKRHASFATWPNENLPSVDHLVPAGFFYTGKGTIVTCFYCNGSLQNWGPNDNPMIEHARWLPHCAYAKQLCGDELYRKIQESTRAQQKRAKANEQKEKVSSGVMLNTDTTTTTKQSSIDSSTLSRLVDARLHLPVSQRLLEKFKLAVIKRSLEDQLRIKQDDFVSDCDIYMACLIIQKQLEYIDGKKENIVVPSKKMRQIRTQNEARRCKQTTNTTQAAPNRTDIEMATSSQLLTHISIAPNPCVVCKTEEKRLVCIPCGHLTTCVPCGHSLKSCPICKKEVQALMRIYQ